MNPSLYNRIPEILVKGKRLSLIFKSVSLKGPDAFRYLQGQITSDLREVSDSNFKLSCLLDNTGKIVAHFYILKQDDGFELLSLPFFQNKIYERLDKYLIADDVELMITNKEYEAVIALQNNNYKNFHKGELFNLPGYLIPKNSANEIELLSNNDFNEIVFYSGETLEAEHTENSLINDTIYIDLATSLKKGCFLGQETVAKIESRRGAAKKWSCLVIEKLSEKFSGTINIEGKEIIPLDTIHNEEGLFLKVPLKRELRVEGKKITVIINGNNYEAKVKYFPISLWNFDSWIEDKYLEAVAVFHTEDYDRAINLLKELIAIKPDYEDAYESLGVILGRQEKFAQAVDYLKKLESINPNSVLVHTNLSLNYMKMGQIELAEEHKAQATIKTFESFGKVAEEKRQLKAQEDEDLQREAMFREVLEIDSEDALANYGLGDIAANRKNFDEALTYLENAIKSDAKYSQAYLRLGEVLIEQNELTKAQTILEKGITIAASAGNLIPANRMQALLDQIK